MQAPASASNKLKPMSCRGKQSKARTRVRSHTAPPRAETLIHRAQPYVGRSRHNAQDRNAHAVPGVPGAGQRCKGFPGSRGNASGALTSSDSSFSSYLLLLLLLLSCRAAPPPPEAATATPPPPPPPPGTDANFFSARGDHPRLRSLPAELPEQQLLFCRLSASSAHCARQT